MPALADAVLPRWFTAGFMAAQPLMLSGIRDVFRHTSGEGYASNCEAIRDADAREEAKTIKAPVLVISGTHDQSTTAAQGRGTGRIHRGLALCRISSKRTCTRKRCSSSWEPDMTEDERYEAGLNVRRVVLGDAHVTRSLDNRRDLTTEFQNLIMRYA